MEEILTTKVNEIDEMNLYNHIVSNSAYLIDLREKEEVEKGFLKNTRNHFPLEELNKEITLKSMLLLDQNNDEKEIELILSKFTLKIKKENLILILNNENEITTKAMECISKEELSSLQKFKNFNNFSEKYKFLLTKEKEEMDVFF